MKKNIKQSAFTTVELLITLFIAALFLVSGYQLYDIIMKDGGGSRATASASNIAYDYLQRYKPYTTNPCPPPQSPTPDYYETYGNLSKVTVTVKITCPYSSTPSISKVSVTVNYNTPQKTINIATYVKP